MRMFILSPSFMFLPVSTLAPGICCAADMQDNFLKAPPEFSERINPVKTDNASIERGKALYIKYCSTCRGQEGLGDGPVTLRLTTEPPGQTAIAGKRTKGEPAWKIATGKNPIPGWQDTLSGKQIWDILNFVQSLLPVTDLKIPGKK